MIPVSFARPGGEWLSGWGSRNNPWCAREIPQIPQPAFLLMKTSPYIKVTGVILQADALAAFCQATCPLAKRSAADVELSGYEALYIACFEQAGVPREAMLESGNREA